LFGFDYDGNYDAQIGFRHNDQHYVKRREQSAANWQLWATHFEVYVPFFREHGIEVINACPTSAIRCFQRVQIQDGVDMLRH
jgi:hypothetical protein